jgi:hypothetical protein
MKKFTKILEQSDNYKSYKANINLEIRVDALDEGEAGYIIDDILGGIDSDVEYTILNIEEESPMDKNK